MAKKKEEELESVESEEVVDKSMISSKDVEEVVQGDEEALSEQMERIKNLTKEQQIQAIEAEKMRQAELARKKQEELLQAQQQAIANEKIRIQKQQEAALLAQKRMEQERLRKQQELEAQQRQQALLQQLEAEKQRIAEEQLRNQKIQMENNKKQPEVAPPPQSEKKSSKEKEDGPTTFKRVMAVILFSALMVMIYFLPQITNYVNEFKNKNNQETITSGILECTHKKTSDNLDILIEASFYFTNKELTKLNYITNYTGDKEDDDKELTKLYNSCLLLKDETSKISGVTIACSLNNGVNSDKQIFDYEKLDVSEVSTAYTEAGGVYPAEFKKSQNIDSIESTMISNGYTCTKK